MYKDTRVVVKQDQISATIVSKYEDKGRSLKEEYGNIKHKNSPLSRMSFAYDHDLPRDYSTPYKTKAEKSSFVSSSNSKRNCQPMRPSRNSLTEYSPENRSRRFASATRSKKNSPEISISKRPSTLKENEHRSPWRKDKHANNPRNSKEHAHRSQQNFIRTPLQQDSSSEDQETDSYNTDSSSSSNSSSFSRQRHASSDEYTPSIDSESSSQYGRSHADGIGRKEKISEAACHKEKRLRNVQTSGISGKSSRNYQEDKREFSRGTKHTDLTHDFEKMSRKSVSSRRKSKKSPKLECSSEELDSSSERNSPIKLGSTMEVRPAKRSRYRMDDNPLKKSSHKAKVDEFEQEDNLPFYKSEMVRHRKIASRASWRSRNETVSERFQENYNSPSSCTGSKRQSLTSRPYLSERKPRYDPQMKDEYRRRSLNHNTSLPSGYSGRRRSIDASSFSYQRHSVESESIFPKEFKSRFYESIDEFQLENSRRTLQHEMTTDIGYVDTHCHIDFLFKRLAFYRSMDEYMEQTFFKFPSNFEGCIADWCQPSLYRQARSILRANNSKFKLWGAFGCHPHFVKEYSDRVEQEIEEHISDYSNIIAWGEMGLDYSDRFGPTDHDLQQTIFIRQLKRACRRNLPLVIHCRDADPDLLRIMKQYVPHDTMIHRHCLTTEERVVRPLLDHFPNCYVGFTNLLTNRSAYRPRDAVSKIPLDRIVLETDAPYFIPRCVTAASSGNAKWSHPGMASSVACEIAHIKDMELDEVMREIRQNVTRLYDI